MRRLKIGVYAAVGIAFGLAGCGRETHVVGNPEGMLVHREMADPSAAVAIGDDSFLVASDEDNVLRLYSRTGAGFPTGRFDLSEFLGMSKKNPEADIEGASQLGDRVYWITSHARNKTGKERPNRYRLFATETKSTAAGVEVAGVGIPYRDLLSDLLGHPELSKYKLADAATRAPKTPGALNIEGLAATPDGKLLIGFRNPVPAGKALLVPLENPAAVVEGKPARLGSPIELDLEGLGIRSIEHSPIHGGYLIVAGAQDGEDASRLYVWSGKAADVPRPVAGVDLSGWNPEALVFYSDETARVQVLSDDGGVTKDGQKLKDMSLEERHFRSGWIAIPAS